MIELLLLSAADYLHSDCGPAIAYLVDSLGWSLMWLGVGYAAGRYELNHGKGRRDHT